MARTSGIAPASGMAPYERMRDFKEHLKQKKCPAGYLVVHQGHDGTVYCQNGFGVDGPKVCRHQRNAAGWQASSRQRTSSMISRTGSKIRRAASKLKREK